MRWICARWNVGLAEPTFHLAQIQRIDLVHPATATLEALDARSWPTDGLRELAEARLAGGRWGLPDGLSERARRVIARAATLGTVADLGLDQLRDAHSLEVTARRREELLRLRREGDHALAAATNVAALHLAGWRGPDRD